MAAFAGAIVSATLAASEGGASEPRISASWSGIGRDATATVEAKLTGLAASSTGRMAVRGLTRRGSRVALFKAAARVDAAGEMTVEATVAGVGRYRAIDVRFIVEDAGELIEDSGCGCGGRAGRAQVQRARS